MSSSNTSWLYGENKIQRPITINGAVNTALPVIRAEVLKNKNLKRDMIFGNGNLGVPGGTPNSLLNIKRYRPVFHHKDAGRTTGFEEYSASTTAVFQALNGVPVEPRFGSGAGFRKEEFRRLWRCPGLSMTDYNFDLPEQTPSGVAIMISGAADTINNGPDTWHVGDRLVFTAPSLDQTQQLQERDIVARNPGEHRDRIEFIIRPVQHIEATLWFEEAFTRFFSSAHTHSPKTSGVDVLLGRPSEGDDGAQRAAVGLFTFIKEIILATCVSLSLANVRPNLDGINLGPEGKLDADSRMSYSAVLQSLNEKDIQSVYDANMRETSLTEISRCARTWMLLLGLVPTRAHPDPSLGMATKFVDQIVHLSCPGGILLRDNFDYFNWARFIPAAELGTVYEPSATYGVGHPRPNLSDMWGAQLHLSRSAFRTTLRGMKDSILDQLNAYVGTANEITVPGAKGNIRR